QVGRHHLHLRLAGVQPPLPGHGDHAHQHLGVHRGELLVVAAAAEEVAEYVLDLAGDIADQAAERAGPGGGGGADQEPEGVGGFLDVTEQRDRGRFKLLPGVGAAENGRRRGEQAFYLTIHHDRVQALLAAEVLVDDGLGHSCLRRDLLDGGAFEAPLGEQPAADVEQLLPALPAGHALAVVVASGRIGHAPIIAVMPPSGHPALPQSTRQQDCWARGACYRALLVIEPSDTSRCPVSLADSRRSSGHRTSQAQPSCSAHLMTRALMSIWPWSAPCRAHVGSQWCRLCQDSPKEGMASQATLRDLSLTSKSSVPNVWHTELIDQVTWCSRQTRTRLAQKKAVSAPASDIDHRPPISAGPSREIAAQRGNALDTRRMLRSASRAGQNFCCEVRLGSNIQPMCADRKALVSAFQSVPNRHGECGSPSRSLYLWCRR